MSLLQWRPFAWLVVLSFVGVFVGFFVFLGGLFFDSELVMKTGGLSSIVCIITYIVACLLVHLSNEKNQP